MDGLLQKCPINSCDVDIALDRLCCTAHWYMVPKALRDRVYTTWRKRQRTRRAARRDDRISTSAAADAVREHEQAKSEAITAVEQRLAGRP